MEDVGNCGGDGGLRWSTRVQPMAEAFGFGGGGLRTSAPVRAVHEN